ncbi:MAG: hypothetical protein KBD00_04415 [Candidatus Peribacteraceae bacterium]|nr:hypothetical protein [Candidatus Peribacteraceae bacterium]
MPITHPDSVTPQLESGIATSLNGTESAEKADAPVSQVVKSKRNEYVHTLTVSMDGIRIEDQQQALDPAILAKQVQFNKWRAERKSSEIRSGKRRA